MSSTVNVLIKATDEASGVMSKAASNITGSLDSIEKKAATLDQNTGVNWRNVATGFAGIATSAFSIYNAYDRVSEKQLQLDKANTTAASKLEILGDKQEDYNEALAKYGENSSQAKEAAENLEVAQLRYADAVSTVDKLQGDLAETIIGSGIQMATTGLTLVDSTGKVVGQFKNLGTAGQGASGSMGEASKSGGSLTSILGLLGIATAGVGLSVNETTGRLDAMASKGVEVTDAERVLTTTSEMLGAGIGITLAQQIQRWLGLLDESEASVVDMTGKLRSQNATVDQATEVLARMGYSQTFINQVTSALVNMGSTGTSNLNRVASAAYGTSNALNSISYAAQIASNKVALVNSSAVAAQSTYVAGVPKAGYVPVMGEGGIVQGPTIALIGEKGPEAVVPLREFGGGKSLGMGPSLTVNFYVAGNADEATARLAADLVMQNVRRIIQT